MVYILCDHPIGNALILLATHHFFVKHNIDIIYILSQKNINLLQHFPYIKIKYICRDSFDVSKLQKVNKHYGMNKLNIENLNENTYITDWYGQRMEYLKNANLRTIFKTNLHHDQINHTVVHIRVGDIDKFDLHFHNKNTIGKPNHHFPVPVQVYHELISKTEPITIVSQTEDNKYVQYLKQHFNIINVISSGDKKYDVTNPVLKDFAALQSCTETIISSCSTFSWCACVSSNAKRIIFPSQGIWHHTNRDKIDLYLDDDRVEWFDVVNSRFI